jgi:hypothetical protein
MKNCNMPFWSKLEWRFKYRDPVHALKKPLEHEL